MGFFLTERKDKKAGPDTNEKSARTHSSRFYLQSRRTINAEQENDRVARFLIFENADTFEVV